MNLDGDRCRFFPRCKIHDGSVERRPTSLAYNVKLNEDDVREIRRRWRAGETARALSKEFNVSETAAQNVVNYVTWRWVKE